MSRAETIQDWHNGAGKYAGEKEKKIEEEYRSTSFDGGKGQIISIAWAVEDSPINTVFNGTLRTEADYLRSFFDNLKDQLNGRPPYFIGHYIGGFDLKFIYRRAVILGVQPPFRLPFDGRHGKDYFCTMQAWCGYKDRISQDNLCKVLGIEGKPSDIDGSKVWDFIKEGRIEEVVNYNRDDVDKVRKIYRRLNFIKGAP